MHALQLLIRSSGYTFAIPADYVKEICAWREPSTKVGCSAPALGLLHHRGEVLLMVGLESVLGLPAAGGQQKMLVVLDGECSGLVLCVDQVLDVLDTSGKSINGADEAMAKLLSQGLLRSIVEDTAFGAFGVLELPTLAHSIGLKQRQVTAA